MPAVWAARAITPHEVLARVRVSIEAGVIGEVRANTPPEAGDEVFEDATLLPGLVDLQVNGGAGAAFDAEEPEERARATRFHVEQGTTSLLATLISAPQDRLESAIGRLAADSSPRGPVLGIHLEGPFLSAERSGAHPAAYLSEPSSQAVRALIEAAAGTLRLVTLAPELPGALDAIQSFAAAGAVVGAGHSRARYVEICAAIEVGLSFLTHLGNASDWPSRSFDPVAGYRTSEPGLVGSFLIDRRLRGSLILDGWHLHPGLARALVELRGAESVALVSDATPAAGRPPGRYRLGGLDVEVHPEGYATAGQGLAGSTIALVQALRTAVRAAGLPLEVAVRMATATPAEILGLAGRKGSLLPGRDADLLVLGPELEVQAVYRAGSRLGPRP